MIYQWTSRLASEYDLTDLATMGVAAAGAAVLILFAVRRMTRWG